MYTATYYLILSGVNGIQVGGKSNGFVTSMRHARCYLATGLKYISKYNREHVMCISVHHDSAVVLSIIYHYNGNRLECTTVIHLNQDVYYNPVVSTNDLYRSHVNFLFFFRLGISHQYTWTVFFSGLLLWISFRWSYYIIVSLVILEIKRRVIDWKFRCWLTLILYFCWYWLINRIIFLWIFFYGHLFCTHFKM